MISKKQRLLVLQHFYRLFYERANPVSDILWNSNSPHHNQNKDVFLDLYM
jgi:hypothetical protein